jgi:hypothetical protein
MSINNNKPFALNFNNNKKIVTIELLEEDGIFQLANLFKALLDEAGIANNYIETPIEDAEQETEDKQD